MEQEPLRVIQVAKLPTKTPGKNEVLKLLATLCYFYPQYTLAAARRLPYTHVVLLLKVARQQEAIKNHNQTMIAAAPHTKKGQAVKDLLSKYEGSAEDG